MNDTPLTPASRNTCPTCSPPYRHTVGMVCQTCGTDYGPRALIPAEQAAAEAIAAEQNRIEVANGNGAAAAAGDYADYARSVVAAVRQPIADEIALELGRDALRDGLRPFLDRLVGPENAKRLLAPIGAETLRQAAEHIENLPPGGEALKGPVWYRGGLSDAAGILHDRAAEVEQEARDGQ